MAAQIENVYFLEVIPIEPANIMDVAKAAGVSLATVSRVVRNMDCVRPATRDKVLQVIQELNYKPNALGRQLRTQETKTIIVIVPDNSNTFFHEILLGIETEAEKEGYQVLIADMHNEPSIENHYFHAIQQRQADGIISLSASIAQGIIKEAAEEYPVVVAVQYMEDNTVPNISIDNMAAARAVTEHLIRLGHRRIAHLSSSPDAPLYRDRFNGYLAALQANGIPVDLKLVRYSPSSIMGGYEQMEFLLALDEPITAVFAAGDVMAIGAMKALKKAGRRVPEDCAVVGFDDIELSSIWEPSLTTIRQPKLQIGQQAFHKLLKLMRKEPVLFTQDILPYELVIRESCGYQQQNQKRS